MSQKIGNDFKNGLEFVPKSAGPSLRLGRETEVVKHSLTIEGHRTSISLEQIFWDQVKELASQKNRSLASLVSEIDSARGEANLSSAIRVFVLRSALSK